MKKSVLLFIALLLTTGTAQAQDTLTLEPVVVTASHIATPLSRTASSITVINAEQIAASGQPLVTDVLRQVPGLEISRAGGGGNVSIFIRGTDNKHTLVLVDGIEYSDPAEIGASANIAHLTTSNIDRIEIVRGPQSVIYGSDAIGGVINIITRKGADRPAAHIEIEGGSFNSWQQQAGLQVGDRSGYLSFVATHADSDGFSAAHEKYGNREKDGYRNTTFSLNTGGRYTDTFELDISLRYSDSDYDYDDFKVDANHQGSNQTLNAAAGTLFHLADDRWQLKLAVSHTGIDRADDHADWGESDYQGTKNKLEWQNTLRLDQRNQLVAGAEIEQEQAENSFGQNDKGTHRGAYLEHRLTFGTFSSSLGARLDDHQEFGSHSTWRFAPTYTFTATGTRIKASVGTGFKAPSLFQLYDNFSGNRDLKPEKSTGYDIGVEQTLLGGLLVAEITVFHNDISNYINYVSTGDWTGEYRNAGDIRTRGVETVLGIYPSDRLDVQLGYTYTDTKNREDGSRLLKRPLHRGHLNLTLYPLDRVQISGNLTYVGKRDDFGDAKLPSYTLVNVAASYQLTDYCKLFGRIDNLFDKEYEEVAGYGTAGLSAYAGIRLSF